MKRRSRVSAISCLIVVLATLIIAFLCIDQWDKQTIWPLIFIVFAECVFFGQFILAEKLASDSKQLITRSAFGISLSVYSVASFVLSLYFMFVKPVNGGKVFAIVQIFMICVVAILLLITSSASKSIHEKDSKTMSQVNLIRDCCSRLKKLSESVNSEEQSNLLKKLADDLYFTNISAKSEVDSDLNDIISAMEIEYEKNPESADEAINSLCVKLRSLISQRKIATESRRGGI